MISVLPGHPESRIQGLAMGNWNNRQLSAYISGTAFTIIEGSDTIIQTVCDDNTDHPLHAIVLDERSGNIATCSATEVRVYKPRDYDTQVPKWIQAACFDIPHASPQAICFLSWGRAEELLVAGKSLLLYNITAQPFCLWKKLLPSPAQSAIVTHDSSYIASIGQFDQLPKVWRRLTYGSDDIRFDVQYLHHPDAIISIRWRKPPDPDKGTELAFYTFCCDGFIRVWNPVETHTTRHWQVVGKVDMSNLSPGAPITQIVCIVNVLELKNAEDRTLEQTADDRQAADTALDHFPNFETRNFEACITIDIHGSLTAWAFENPGTGAGKPAETLNITQISSQRLDYAQELLQLHNAPHVHFQGYCNRLDGRLHIACHIFDGRIGMFEANAADLFDPTIKNSRLSCVAVWSGHSTAIEKIVRSFDGRTMVSRTDDGEYAVWEVASSPPRRTSGLALNRRSLAVGKRHIHCIGILRQGSFILTISDDLLSVWDCQSGSALLTAQCPLQIAGLPLCLIRLPRIEVGEPGTLHFAAITSTRQGAVWEIDLPSRTVDRDGSSHTVVHEFCRFDLGIAEDLTYVAPVDPAGSESMTLGSPDTLARDLAISCTCTGRVDFWTVRVDALRRNVEWLSTCHTKTNVSEPALASGTLSKTAAMVNDKKSRMAIWDICVSRLEFEANYDGQDAIRSLDWTSTPQGQLILAVGLQHQVVLLSQMRFDYLNEGPAWAPIHTISLGELSPHPVGDSVWLEDGFLAIGVGNQLFVFDKSAGSDASPMTEISWGTGGTCDLFDVARKLNDPVPVFHPQFLGQCILAGKGSLVRRILAALHEKLEFLTPGESIDGYLGLELQSFYTNLKKQAAASTKATWLLLEGQGDNERERGAEEFSKSHASSVITKLEEIAIPRLSGPEQIQLAEIVECVGEVERHRRSMDENGARFMLFCRQNALKRGQTGGTALSWREINWAFHSNSQQLLADFVSQQSRGKMLWEQARESGIFMWLSDSNAVKSQFEAIARNIYTCSEAKNPVDCSLFYLALRKKTVLQALWRVAHDNKEQAATLQLLANNFEEPKWKRVALKNAYALLSKRRFEYAAAFFLLAGHLDGAVEVCLGQLHDVQLALATARVYEGEHGPIVAKILRQHVLPMAVQTGDRWLASWAFWKLGCREEAVRALMMQMPVCALAEAPCPLGARSRSFLTDDPSLVVLYSQLKQLIPLTRGAASMVTSRTEWDFVLHSARLYKRMGCHVLGLDLVCNWVFQEPVSAAGRGRDTTSW